MLKLWARLAILVKKRVRDSIIAKIALVLSLVVVFCTTYLLILPALTISTGNSSSVFQSSDGASSQVESTTNDSQKENNQTEASSQASPTESSQEKKDMSQAGTLTAETSDVTVTVSYEGDTFTEPVQLKAKPVSDTTAIDNKLTSLLSESKQSLSQAHSYDISFITDGGKEVEPSKDVKVSMAFKNDLSTSDDKQAGWKLYHFVDNDVNQVQDLTESTDTDIKENGDGAVESVDFKSNTFSTYTLAGVTYADFSGYLTGYSFDTNSTKLDLATNQVTTKLTLDFTNLSQADLVKRNDYYLSLPESVIVNTSEEYNVLDHSGNKAGTFHFHQDEKGRYYMLIHFNNDYVNKLAPGTSIDGDLYYDMTLKSIAQEKNGDYVADFSDKVHVTITEQNITKNYDINTKKKSELKYEGDTPYITYTVTVDSLNGTPSTIDVNDAISDFSSLQKLGIAIDGVDNISVKKSTYTGSSGNVTKTEDVSATPKFDKSKGKWSLNLPQLTSGGIASNGQAIGHFYTITYRYKLSGLKVGSMVSVKNEVTATSKTNDNDKVSKSSSSEVTLKLNDIKKTGKYDDKTGLITWKITVNPDGNDIGGATLKDDLFKDATSITVALKDGSSASGTFRYYDSNNKQLDDNIKDFSKVAYIRFSGQKGKKSNTKSYVITYTTKATNLEWGQNQIRNNAILDDDGDQTSDEETVTVPGSSSGSGSESGTGSNTGGLSKSVVGEKDGLDSDTKIITWKVTITMPSSGVIKAVDANGDKTKFRDYLKDPYNQKFEHHWYTKAQLKVLYQKLVKVFGKEGFTLEARQPNYGPYTDYKNLDDSTHYSEFQIELTKDFTSSQKEVSFQYDSTAKFDNRQIVSNEITSEGSSASADFSPKVLKMDGDGNPGTTTKTSEDGIVTWKIKVNLASALNAKSMTITDTLPDGVSLTGLTYGKYNGLVTASLKGGKITGGDDSWGTKNISLSGKISGNKIILDFKSTNSDTLVNNIAGDKDFWITVTTTYNNVPEVGKKVTANLTNTVTVSVDGKAYDSDDQTQIVTIGKDNPGSPSEGSDSTKISKVQTGETNNQNYDTSGKGSVNTDSVGYTHVLNYSVDINSQAEDLASGSDTLTLTDTIEYYKEHVTYTLLQSSVVLYDANGNVVPNSAWSWTYKDVAQLKDYPTHTRYGIITVTLPDSGHYTLKYNYQISDASDGSWLEAKNTAKLEGVNKGTSETTTNYQYLEQSGGGNVYSKGTYTLTKVDEKNFGITLPGAEFKVYQYGNDKKAIATYTTDKNGEIHITNSDSKQKYQYEAVYYVVETKAPAGYEDPKNPTKYYFTYSKVNTNLDFVPIELKGKVKDLSNDPGLDLVPNKKIKQTNLTVKKEWLRADGSKTERSDGSITYNLIQVATDSQGNSTETVYKSGETLTHDDDWTRTYKGLPVSGKNAAGNEVDYKYYVRETPVSGYDTSYSNGETPPDNPKPSIMATDSSNGQITIKNKAQKQYNLPETGGSGVKMHYLLGAVLVLLTTGLIILKAYKTYQAGGDS
ncbi:SpaA isopeptide-forming pilin-related protein [Streptococcus equinus]|uniref:SpaA isopeptide-forming pilin-related protein n=1 Tax=Streptococcus equinus TaxID=1335 RepID=UPI0008903613|nr:SpaA isopeptide-forming pilin-related protein [Streptococcus equinus]SDQ39407.1 Cna protein B-type domain-containing protein [Streptococcus equinus]